MSINIQGYLETIRAPWGQLFYDLVWDQLPLSGKTVLDFGSGFGLTAAHLAQCNQVTAIEPHADMLAHRVPGGYRQLQGGVELLAKFADASFDVILCHNVLEYVADRAAVLAAFARLLKPGGMLSVVKHNPAGKIMQKAVFECNPEEALSLLHGQEATSVNFGTIREYDTAELEQGPFRIEKTLGVRTFFALQRNEVKTEPDWRQRMFRLEQAAAEVPALREVAFFHHVLLRCDSLTQADHDLIRQAVACLRANRDEVRWNHTVGCGLRCKDGRVFLGVNCDGIHGACAEYVAMGMAVSAGARDFDAIVAVHEDHPNSIIPPCGNCRQMLLEYCPDVLVIVNDGQGRPIKVRARDLMPFAWEANQ